MNRKLPRLAGSLLIASALMHITADAGLTVTPDNEAQILNLGGVNTPYSEYTPFITADEHYLFFQSNRPGGVGDAGDFDLWYAENQASEGIPKFKPAANAGLPVNSLYFDGHPSLRKLPTGDYEMYFCSFAEDDRPGPQLTNIYYSIFKDGKWQPPVPVLEINTDFHDRMPSISQDGHYLFFSSDRPGGFGRDDIWVSEYDFAAKRWGKPANAGRTINTPASEVTPAIHSDNITLYFSSDRAGGAGGYDIYVTQMMQNGPAGNDTESLWKKPVNLGLPFNSNHDDEYPTVIRSGSHMYFASNRDNGQGSFDIYRAKVPEFAKPEVVVTLRGRVKEKFSEKGIEANIRISDADGERNFSTHQPEGLYSANLINKKQYKMTVTAPGYQAIEYIADLREVHTPIIIQKDFEMERTLALPKEINVRITFVNEKDEALKPNATYRLSPDIKDDTILPFRNGVGVLKIPAMSRYKKPEEALAALERMQLSVNAKQQGYNDLAEMRMVSDLLRGKYGEMNATIDLKLVMKSGESTPDVQVVDCKAGKGCVAIAYFSTNVARRLDNEKAAGLKKVVELWNKQPHKYVYVHGHADNRGSPAYNMKLSKARAVFVKKRLVAYGIPAEMIVIKAFGETKPASADASAEGMRLNRRAEIYFNSTKAAGDEATKEEPGKKPAVKKDKKETKKTEPVKDSKKPLPPEEVKPSKPAKESETKKKPAATEPAEPEADSSDKSSMDKPADAEPPADKPVEVVAPAEKPAETPAKPKPKTEIRIK